ncbi:glycosyltransferase family 9 protein [Methylobacterium trifolii]|uniref:Glycosyltransferase family 9 protein n=1 Tax=Methylobacterium trifolii TaxID=1003092 RepID=A0ABQ4TSR4_9HYPH|nr:glycosyltransferase family 9 protein [Methylobacterium trifolii]GJE58363.1 hypothetical protein MPOCJGCO_0442 [Methylobacterium trifolii]
MSLAIVKPDHLGDLILSSGAIRAMCAARPDATVFVATKNLALARLLFPGIEIRAIDLPHLAKAGGALASPDLSPFEVVAMLRNDHVLNRQWAELRTRSFVQPEDTHEDHQSLIDYTVAARFAGFYDIDRAFFGTRLERVTEKAGRVPKRIGLSIGSGFHANAWPTTRWIDMARHLLETADAVTLIGGPAEQAKAAFIRDRLGRPAAVSLLIGGGDLAGFIGAVDDLDLVVASDGGTAHLCSLTTPIISVFGPSPFRRYAPFGRLNRLLTREMSCSPCCQYAAQLFNGCLTTECMTGLRPENVGSALDVRMPPASRARSLTLGDGVRLHIGVSHLDRERKLAGFHEEVRDAYRIAS